jgi:hypothetical protein
LSSQFKVLFIKQQACRQAVKQCIVKSACCYFNAWEKFTQSKNPYAEIMVRSQGLPWFAQQD